MPDMGAMIYDTKTALILRRDLAAWQMANVAAFLAGGLTGTHGPLMGEPYRDAAGHIVGVLGVIGPTRLNYARVIPTVDYAARIVSRMLGG